ncbi:MAG TPA: argininosuccinate lyase [Terriglobales bacterium]|jgi:argininosuccinate lyase|nr:argininosuccinate lyase [Terriglobales bacterium]
MWSGRFRQPLDPAFEAWQRSWEFDCRLLECELEASSAHARALAKAEVLSPPELKTILEGLEQIGERVAQDPELLEDDEAEDVHHFVEKLLVAIIGDLGYKLHSGRSRNEQIATDLRLYTRAACDEISAELSKLISTFLDRAEKAEDAAMPAYTHLQRAEPVLIAHWLLAYAEMLLRDLERLEDCRNRLNVCPLGSGAVAGTTLPLDRELMSSELGFRSPTANSMDATSDRDFVIEFANDASLLAIHLSRWAEEMLLFSTQEYGFIHPPEAFSTGSSAMPQKMNGDLLELTRGKAGRILGSATSLLVLLKGLPLAYNKDMQETQEALFQVTETVVSLIPLVTGWMESAEFDFARMQRAAETGYMNAFAAATYLVRKGVPFRIAHEIVGKAVRLALDRQCELQDLKLMDLQEFDLHFGEDFFEFVTLKNVLAIHDVSGGTAPARVKEAIVAARKRLGAVHEESHAHA